MSGIDKSHITRAELPPAGQGGTADHAGGALRATGGLRRLKVEGPNGPPLYVVSVTDAVLEAAQLRPDNQVFYGDVTQGLIKLHPGDTVVDVGANVGSFARLAARVVGSSGHVYAVEPIVQIYRALELNCRAFADHYHEQSKESSRPAPITPVHAGVVEDAHLGIRTFTYFPRCTAFSTQATLRDDEDALQSSYSIVRNSAGRSTTWLQALARQVAWLLPHYYRSLHRTVTRYLLLRGAVEEQCPVVTLSDLISDHQIQRIDLLKINVERGELGVLKGLRAEHWSRVRQVSMQLHDTGTRLQEALDVLSSWGLRHTHVYKEPRFKDSCLVQVYASRVPADAVATDQN